MLDEIIEIKDFDLAKVIREQLEQSGKRDNRFKTLVYRYTFTKEELESITTLKLKDGHFRDISELKYLTNLVDLEISSVNAKDVSPKFKGGLQPQYRYDNAQIKTKDFSVISSLTKLKYLTINYVDGLEQLDISALENLAILELEGNSNLTQIIGLEDKKSLETLTLLKNGITRGFNLEKLLDSSLVCFNLDFDLYPILKKVNPNIDEIIKRKDGHAFSWLENISDIRYNSISSSLMRQMDDKVKEILTDIVNDSYTDIEKICAIYAYIIQNVKYDYDALNASKSDDARRQFAKSRGSTSITLDKVIDRKQSSFNAIMEGRSVCEGYTNLMHYMLKSVGIESVACSCSATPDKDFVGLDSNHAVIRVKIGEDWFYFDPTWDANKTNLEHFFKSRDVFSRTHTLSMTESQIEQPKRILITNDDLNRAFAKVLADRSNGNNRRINMQKSDLDGVMYMEQGFGKVLYPPEKKIRRPIISESVKKSVILRDQKQKLHEMKQQLLDLEQQRKEQEIEYEEEESHGMSM